MPKLLVIIDNREKMVVLEAEGAEVLEKVKELLV